MQGRRSISSRREATRLPRIAPRTGAGPSTLQPQRSAPPSWNSLSHVSRTRLPPRSRTGCWTCRRRKVKCDEQRPNCGHCARLGHDCDYNPRLVFKDDTSTAMRRMRDVTTTGISVWDLNLPKPEYRLYRFQQDSLPPFSSLATDEDREKKAQTREAGTYVVIATPSSFANLPEYGNDDPSSLLPRAGQSNCDVLAHSIPNSSNIHSATEELDDPNVIILRTFEDYVRRSPVSAVSSSSPVLATASQPPTALGTPAGSVHTIGLNNEMVLSRLDEARNGGRDAHLLEHYRSHISEQVIKVGSPDVEEDAFETQARTFPPLFHAMMAISALSLSHKVGTPVAEALEHYAQVLPAMGRFVQRVEDSYSDGPLFTHYLLLLYETASAGPSQYSDMWQSHRRTLLTIISKRWQADRTEPHGFLVLFICLVDTYALLSGSGDGAFVTFIMKNNMLAPQDCLPPLAPGLAQRYFDEELPYFPGLLELNQQLIRLATKVGRTARTLRAEDQRRVGLTLAVHDDYTYEESRQIRVRALQNLCRTLASDWAARYPQYWSKQPAPRNFPYRVRGFCDHVYTLYRACVIYSHTSLYSGQMASLTTDVNAENEVSSSVTEIIELSKQTVTNGRWELQFMPFSLFLAGVVSRRKEEKELALGLMLALERKGYGKNTATARRLLEKIYDEQQSTAGSSNPDPRVEWLEVMERCGLRLVIFGM